MAARYFLNIGTDWGSTANWSDTSGGAGGFSVPTSADDVFFDANSGPCTLGGNRECLTVNFTGYINTLTIGSNNLSIRGGYTLISTLSVSATTGRFIVQAITPSTSFSLTNNGYTFIFGLTIIGTTTTITLNDDIKTSIGTTLILQSAAGSPLTLNGNKIEVGGSLSVNNSNGVVQGTTDFLMNGTGNLTTPSTGYWTNNTELNTTGLITFVGNIRYGLGTFIIATPDNVEAGNSTFFIVTTTSNFQSNGFKFWNMNIWILTFIGDLTILGDLTIGLSNTTSGLQGGNVYLYGNIIMNGALAGTTTIDNLYIVGNSPTSFIWTAAIPNILLIPNLVINTPTRLFLFSRNASGLLVLRTNITHILGRIEMPIKTNRLVLSPGGSSSFIGDIRKYRLRNIRIAQNQTLTFNDSFFCGMAEEPLDIRTATPYPYTENLDYDLTYNVVCNKPMVSHFTKIKNAVNTQACVKMTYPKANSGGNRGILFMGNQLPKAFADGKPLIQKEPMFGKLTADPMIVR